MKVQEDQSSTEKYYEDFYQKLRRILDKQLKKYHSENAKVEKTNYQILVGYLTLLPDLFHLAIRMLLDKSIPANNKGALVAGIVYVISPIDLIPDAIPVAGWIDDLIVIVMALNKFLETEDPHIKAQVEKHWAGDSDLFENLKHIIEVADSAAEFLPRNLLKIVKSMFK